ncbi:hypothetical protein EV426DRAFT_721046 [Tirmania nivea]|nr:hypothetical protein EV426DRAFT_721046 [Tirmania nivea]
MHNACSILKKAKEDKKGFSGSAKIAAGIKDDIQRGTALIHTRQPLWQTQRKVRTQQLEQLQTREQHHETALAAYNRNIYSNLGGTTFVNLSPSFEALELFFSPRR